MESIHNEINDITQFEVDKKRIEKLQRKHKPKTKVQRMKGFFTILFAVGVLCQFLSALLASSGVLHYVSSKLNSNGLIISLTSICILAIIEVSKRFTLESFHAQRLDDKEINRVTYAFMFLWGSLSVCSTYYGTPYAVEFFAAKPELISIDSIESNYNSILSQQVAILEKEIETHEATALDIKNRSSWKGRISRNARPAYLAAVTAKEQSETNLSAVALSNSKEKQTAIEKANSANEQIERDHLTWCMSFGASLAIVSIFLELLFFVSFWWCENYNRLEVTEAKAIQRLRNDKGTLTETNSTLKRNNKTNNDKTPGTDKQTVNIPNRTVITAFGTNNPTANIRTCSNCGTDISSKRSDARFCSTKCRGLHHKAKK